jgi:hypothetical protein
METFQMIKVGSVITSKPAVYSKIFFTYGSDSVAACMIKESLLGLLKDIS